MTRLMVLITVTFLMFGCATKTEVKKLNDRLEFQETELAALEEGVLRFGADYTLWKQELQKFNIWVYSSLKEMEPHVHTHPNLQEPEE